MSQSREMTDGPYVAALLPSTASQLVAPCWWVQVQVAKNFLSVIWPLLGLWILSDEASAILVLAAHMAGGLRRRWLQIRAPMNGEVSL